LKQRVAHWFRLHVLSEDETSDYVRHRLKLAGDKSGAIFTATALERVYCYSHGAPRLINTLCDNAMMSAFALRNERVTPELIVEAATDLCLKRTNGNGHSAAAEARWAAGEQTHEEEVASFAAVLKEKEPEIHSYPELDSLEKKESQ
jgi:general secretion pathway protein A